jgi:hypothetical protein
MVGPSKIKLQIYVPLNINIFAIFKNPFSCFFHQFCHTLMSVTWEHISFCVVLSSRYTWTFSEVEEVQGASVIVAADVIYSDDLTDAFFGVLERLMSLGSEKVQIKHGRMASNME